MNATLRSILQALASAGRLISTVTHPVITSHDDRVSRPRTTWTVADCFEPTLPSDIDVLTFDPARTHPSYEKDLEERLRGLRPGVRWEVANQATIHRDTGDTTPYNSIEDAMSRWADLVTAVCARLDPDDNIKIIAPGGLDDLFDLRVRPNIATPTSDRGLPPAHGFQGLAPTMATPDHRRAP